LNSPKPSADSDGPMPSSRCIVDDSPRRSNAAAAGFHDEVAKLRRPPDGAPEGTTPPKEPGGMTVDMPEQHDAACEDTSNHVTAMTAVSCWNADVAGPGRLLHPE